MRFKQVVASAILLLAFECAAAQSATQAVDTPCDRSGAPRKECSFRWRDALLQSGALLAIQHGLNAHNYDRPPGGFFENYAASVAGYRFGAWDDGDPAVYNYVAHPLMGAITGRIQVQNDPVGARLQFGASKPYLKSRARALAWAAAYSVQWEIGPLSESSIGNYGMRPYYRSRTGAWTNGTGLGDLVVTPLAGTAVLVAEDWVDARLVVRLEPSRSPLSRVLISLLNPARSAANLLRWRPPWYRDGRPR